eukprot:TRINITY_DN2671_c0_g1_i1.p1 TRINITY_DN2671_c0_g1~~TRINITY_DN2671_c0_g1_i1.p1  ORF type:complete len:491 (+),score=144.02 TRINITY_DN2671_c0_g1_i1:39-1475(+)
MEQTRTREKKPEPETAKTETSKNILLSNAIEKVTKALEADEKGKLENAFELYNQALTLLMTVMNEAQTEEQKELYKAKVVEILERAETIKKILADRNKKVEVKPTASAQKIEKELSDDKKQVDCEVIMNVNGVQCYSVVGNEKELIASGNLQILSTTESGGIHFLKLGEFEFPLTKRIPCLRSSKGYYMVPMPGGVFYGFVFPKDIPETYLTIFETQLGNYCDLRVEVEHPESAVSAQTEDQKSSAIILPPSNDPAVKAMEGLASGITTGSKYAIQGLALGTKYATQGIEYSGGLIKSYLAPNEKPAEINPTIKNTVALASTVSPYVVQLSKAVVNGLVLIAEQVGQTVATGIKESSFGQSHLGSASGPKTEAMKKVGESTLTAIANVWESLDYAGSVLLKTTSDTTVGLVHHKYGEEAAQVAANSLTAATDAAVAFYNIEKMGAKKLAKKAAMHTGKATVKNYFEHPKEETPKITEN